MLAERLVIEGGFLKSPEIMATLVHENETFVRLRQYDHALQKLVKPSDDTSRARGGVGEVVGKAFFAMFAIPTPEISALAEGDSDGDDPLGREMGLEMGSAIRDSDTQLPSKRQKKGRPTKGVAKEVKSPEIVEIELPEERGAESLVRKVRALKVPQHCPKTVWLHRDDCNWAFAFLTAECAAGSDSSSEDAQQFGFTWDPCAAAWFARFSQPGGGVGLLSRRVNRHKQVNKIKVAMTPTDYAVARREVKKRFAQDLLAMGVTEAFVTRAASEDDDAPQEVQSRDCQ